jgi:MFS family permease
VGGFGSGSYDVILAGRMVQGIGTTAYESLSVAAIGDVFFLHERGLRTALLVLTLACLSSFVSIIAGTMFEHLGARTLFVVLLPLQIFGLLGTFFFLPESQFRRDKDGAREDSMEPQERIVTSSEAGEKEGRAETQETATSPLPRSPHARVAKRTFLHDLHPFTGITYTRTPVHQLLGEIFVHLLNPAVLWVQLVSAVLVVCTSQTHFCHYTRHSHIADVSLLVLLRRHSLHPRANLHAPTLPPKRQPKRFLLHRRADRWHSLPLRGFHLRFHRQDARAPQQRRLRSRVPDPGVHRGRCRVCHWMVHLWVGGGEQGARL